MKFSIFRKPYLYRNGRSLAIKKSVRRIYTEGVDDLCLEILRSYNIDNANVIICIDKYGTARYIVIEPHLDDVGQKLYSTIMDYLYTSYFIIHSIEDLKKAIENIALNFGFEEEFHKYYNNLLYYVIRDSFGYGILDPVIRDPDIEDIELSDWRKPVTVVHRDFLSYEALTTNIQFASEEEVRSYLERLAIKSGKAVSLVKPELHAALAEGYRIAATLGEPITHSPTFSIRKLPNVPVDILKLIKRGVIETQIAALLWLINDAKMFYSIIGGSGSGKTTLLNAVLQLSNPNWKVIVVQDIPEIRLPMRLRFIQFYGETSEDMLQRCFTALRYRPDILVVGEVRGREIAALVRAAASGSGSATTFHASTSDEYEMALRNLLPQDLYHMLSLNTALVVLISRVRMGHKIERRVWKIYERIDSGWREIYNIDSNLIMNSYTLKRLARRLVRDDIEAELEYRTKVLETINEGYESVERMLRKFYGL
ncbi:MAG: type II/IV secretion system ATPase subunit [Ignisphaera sp.]|nr:type II/IV secretion system ATPase subunit [Ignisphaera sp.]MCX8168459.1 type II/IV secretion system ATPase subunit [Ignisphaera sp.]MDW8085101.1 type II/IV secretion system ATPase subunit [Ignisphaera sp.]